MSWHRTDDKLLRKPTCFADFYQYTSPGLNGLIAYFYDCVERTKTINWSYKKVMNIINIIMKIEIISDIS